MKALSYLLEKIKSGKIAYGEDIKGLILCLIQDSNNVHLSSEDGNLLFEIGDKDLIIEYISCNPLSDDLQLKMLERDDAFELFQKLPKECRFFCEEAEIKMFKHKYALGFIREYIKSSSLSQRAEPLLFELENVDDLIIAYANRHDFISQMSQIKFLQHGFSNEVYCEYIRNTAEPLCLDAELELLKSKYAEQLVGLYIMNHQLSDEALIELCKCDFACNVMETYIKQGWLISNKIQESLLNLENHIKLFKLYVENEVVPFLPSICQSVRVKLFASENGCKFLKKHYNKYLHDFPEVQSKLVEIY